MLHDRDGSYGEDFHRTVAAFGIAEVLTAPRSPWQNPFVERLIGSVRCECLDHVIVRNERHVMRKPSSYFTYYHLHRAHLALDRHAPVPREVEPAERGAVIAISQIGELHHRYTRCA